MGYWDAMLQFPFLFLYIPSPLGGHSSDMGVNMNLLLIPSGPPQILKMSSAKFITTLEIFLFKHIQSMSLSLRRN